MKVKEVLKDAGVYTPQLELNILRAFAEQEEYVVSVWQPIPQSPEEFDDEQWIDGGVLSEHLMCGYLAAL